MAYDPMRMPYDPSMGIPIDGVPPQYLSDLQGPSIQQPLMSYPVQQPQQPSAFMQPIQQPALQPQSAPQGMQPNQLIQQIMQQYMTNKQEEQNAGGLLQSILTKRMQPEMQDIARAGANTTMAFGAPDLYKAQNPEDAMNARITGQLSPYANALSLQKSQFENDLAPYTAIAKLQESQLAARGGVYGALADRLRSSDPTDRQNIFDAMTGFRRDVRLDENGNVVSAPGAAKAEAQKKYASSAATHQAEADIKTQQALPNALINAEQGLKIIDDLSASKDLKFAVGAASLLPTIPDTPQADVRAKIEQLKGKAFLDAYDALRGAGAITEVEGLKGETAKARLQTAQTEPAFREALADLGMVVRAGVNRGKAQASGSANRGLDITGVMNINPAATPGITINNSGGAGQRINFGDLPP